MAKYADFPQETYVALQHIRETALVRFDSLFTPERNLWSSRIFDDFMPSSWNGSI